MSDEERGRDIRVFELAMLLKERGKHPLADIAMEEQEVISARKRGNAKDGWETRKRSDAVALRSHTVASGRKRSQASAMHNNNNNNRYIEQKENLLRTEETLGKIDSFSSVASSSSSSSSSLPVKPPAAATKTMTKTATGGKESLDGTPYAGLEDAVGKSPLSVKRFLSVATAGNLRREAAENWLMVNGAGNWTITEEDGTERPMRANGTARRLAAFCKRDKEFPHKGGEGNVFPRASNYLPPTPEEMEKFRDMGM